VALSSNPIVIPRTILEPAKDIEEEPIDEKPSRRELRKRFTDDEARLARTIFVGNLPINCCKDKVAKDARLPILHSFVENSKGFEKEICRIWSD